MALQLNPLLTQGHIEALEHHASDAQLTCQVDVRGEWHDEPDQPQAAAMSARCAPKPSQTATAYAITGQKIYITWGDNETNANVSHLVLARLVGAATGTKGISLFLVPKIIPNADGSLGAPNSLSVVSLEPARIPLL